MRKKLLIAVCILCAGNFLLAQERKSTAGKNVQVVDTAFFIPQLNRYRRVWIYLPASYNSSKQKYPVIYLQDGQNIFDDKTSFAGEWGIDEAMDTLGQRVGETIVIAIDNGGEKRLSEYAPFDFAIPSSDNAATRQTIKSKGSHRTSRNSCMSTAFFGTVSFINEWHQIFYKEIYILVALGFNGLSCCSIFR